MQEMMTRHSYERYKFLFDNSPIPILETNFSNMVSAVRELKRQGVEDIEAYVLKYPEFVTYLYFSSNIFDVNQAMIEMIEAESKAVFVANFKSVLGDYCRDFFESVIISLFKGNNTVKGESEIYTFNGRKIWVEVTATFLVFEGEEIINYTFKEITEEKLKTEAIRVINERMTQSSTKENLENLVLSLSEVFQVEYVFVAAVTADKDQVKTIALAMNNELQEAFSYVPKGPCAEIHEKQEMIAYNGWLKEEYYSLPLIQELKINSYIGFPLRNRDNEIIGHLTCAGTRLIAHFEILKEVITLFASWASSEMMHFRSMQKLEEKKNTIEQQLKDLNQKNQKLEQYLQSNELLKNFAYIASHDLKAPIRTIISFSQLLKRNLIGKLDEDGEEFLEFIISSSRNMKALIEDLLMFSSIDNQELNIEELYVEDILLSVTSDLQLAIREKNVVLEWENIIEKIDGDFIKLKQLFQNLIFNAIKFQKEGNIPVIRISGTDEGDFWQFSIEDNGIGIEEKYFDRVFSLFQKVYVKDAYEGTGLGLAICKRIVEKHRGDIWLTSVLGEGTTFYFTISK